MTIKLPSLDTPPAGAIRFNSDSGKLEIYRGGIGIGTTNQTGGWWTIDNFSADNATGGARGVFGTVSPTYSNTLEYITISTTGNSIDFGDLIRSTGAQAAMCASSTRGLHGGGIIAPAAAFTNSIEYITISSTGNAADFGDLSGAKRYLSALANATRGIWVGSAGGTINVIEYVTIASIGDVKDFGDLNGGRGITGTLASSTRGLVAGGETPTTATNTIEFITISTVGNAIDFGDLSLARQGISGCSNATRGIFGSGYAYPAGPLANTDYNTIDYVTIASTGDAIDFGDLSQPKGTCFSVSSSTRGVFAGGNLFPTQTNTIEYVTIMNTGNAIDFGDLTTTTGDSNSGMSNAHGGL